jgi:hypothetical protein
MSAFDDKVKIVKVRCQTARTLVRWLEQRQKTSPPKNPSTSINYIRDQVKKEFADAGFPPDEPNLRKLLTLPKYKLPDPDELAALVQLLKEETGQTVC